MSATSTDTTKDRKDTLVLCNACFDVKGENVMAIIPQSTCGICGKRCLGYKTKVEIK